ncbi:hypothetical protein JG688_00000315 [Phytophthora aleatoria]|uniref:Myb-like DNA-binding protein n=1 Tax=Phytophthora aleatoria TaxID=2496075 RepID=A0A8J5JEB5_9STRA|nr:hypothetical protein JG688_00000315 [Phytophthora aleatoria]
MIMMPTSTHGGSVVVAPAPTTPITRGLWSEQEHEQFLHAMKMFPTGPWRSIAAFIGTRSIKQVQTHAQKYQQKINRRRRGLRKQKKKFVRPEHRVDAHATGCIQRVKNFTVQGSPRSPSAFPIGAMSPLSCGFGELLTGGCSPVASDADSSISSSSSTGLAILDMDIDMDPLLCDLEPLPYTSEVSFEQVLADDAYRQDVQESIDLLLA